MVSHGFICFSLMTTEAGLLSSVCSLHICMSSSVFCLCSFFLSVWGFNSFSCDLQVFPCLLDGIFYNTNNTPFLQSPLLCICIVVLSHSYGWVSWILQSQVIYLDFMLLCWHTEMWKILNWKKWSRLKSIKMYGRKKKDP